jgi:glycosyltransferase involved in cell wall biosynthesis
MGYFTFRTDAIRVLDAANVEYDIHRRSAEASHSLLRRLWSGYEARKLRPQEIAICGEQDMIFLPSQRDKELLDRDVPRVPKIVIPNGVDTSFFAPQARPVEDDTLVFTGAINYFPNADAVIWFVSDVLPLIHKVRPGVRFSIVGNAPPESVRRLASSHVEVTGFVDDVRPSIARSAVYVVPIRIGGGTRLKVLEAMAMRKPIVTTSIGCEGIDAAHGKSVLIADTPQAFADATLRLLADRRMAEALADAGHDLVRSRYDWASIGDAMGTAYEKLREKHMMPEGVRA